MNTEKINEAFRTIRIELDNSPEPAENLTYSGHAALEACLISLSMFLQTDCKDRGFLKDAIYFLGQVEFESRID